MTAPGDSAERFAAFLTIAGQLKRVRRSGWVDRGIPPADVESVADHSWRVALMGWLLSGEVEGLNRERVVLLALVHDLAESLAGDMTPYDRNEVAALPPEERQSRLDERHQRTEAQRVAKQAAEDAAMARLLTELPDSQAAELASLWSELSVRMTPEARFVKELDILETYLQSRSYAADFPGVPVRSFQLEADDSLMTGVLQAIRDVVSPIPPDE